VKRLNHLLTAAPSQPVSSECYTMLLLLLNAPEGDLYE
jgi:hypothetical protein